MTAPFSATATVLGLRARALALDGYYQFCAHAHRCSTCTRTLARPMYRTSDLCGPGYLMYAVWVYHETRAAHLLPMPDPRTVEDELGGV